MTVTLAFKAFVSSIPCITPFLATSDPSVLKRILAYIRVTPLLVEHFPKCDPCRRSGKRLHHPAHRRVLAVLGVLRFGRRVSTRTPLSRRSAVIVPKSLRIACFLDGR